VSDRRLIGALRNRETGKRTFSIQADGERVYIVAPPVLMTITREQATLISAWLDEAANCGIAPANENGAA
jgi:hypothetical protein